MEVSQKGRSSFPKCQDRCNRGVDFFFYSLLCLKTEQQQDGFNCGIYVIEFYRFLVELRDARAMFYTDKMQEVGVWFVGVALI